MIVTQSARDSQNKQTRTKNLLAAIKAGRLISLILEPAAACNLTCKFCDLHSGRMDDSKQENGVMSLALYKQILDELENLGFKFEALFFHGLGEPLINRHIVEMVSMAVERNVAKRYSMFTNGTLMKPEILDRLMTSGINEINISLDTVNRIFYKEFKGKDLLPTVLENIEYAIQSVQKSPSIDLSIKCAGVGDQNNYSLTNNDMSGIIAMYKDVAAASEHIHIKIIPINEMIDGLKDQKKEYHTPCEFPFYNAYIKWDGRVSSCCADVIDALNIGNIGQDKFIDIIKGSRLQKIRKVHLSGNFDQIPLCKYCGARTVVDLTDNRDELLTLI